MTESFIDHVRIVPFSEDPLKAPNEPRTAEEMRQRFKAARQRMTGRAVPMNVVRVPPKERNYAQIYDSPIGPRNRERNYARIYDYPIGPRNSANLASIVTLQPYYPLRMRTILAAALHLAKMSEAEFKGRGRQRRIVRWRHVTSWAIRRYTPISLLQAGAFLNRDHTSVMHGIEVVERDRMEYQPEIGLLIDVLDDMVETQSKSDNMPTSPRGRMG